MYQPNHDLEIQQKRGIENVPCGLGGVVHDYIAFYFGYLSPMMLQLKTNQVSGYTEGQEPLIYLVSAAQVIHDSGTGFVFSDGHGIAVFTEWFDDLADLDKVDWDMVNQRYWSDNSRDMDRQRRKQAEFLVSKFCCWEYIQKIVVINQTMKSRVEEILKNHSENVRRPIQAKRDWYYH